MLPRTPSPLHHHHRQEKQPPLPPEYSDDLRTLVDQLLQKDPSLRPDAMGILEIPFIAERVRLLRPVLEGEGGAGSLSTLGRARPLMMPAAGPAQVCSGRVAGTFGNLHLLCLDPM